MKRKTEKGNNSIWILLALKKSGMCVVHVISHDCCLLIFIGVDWDRLRPSLNSKSQNLISHFIDRMHFDLSNGVTKFKGLLIYQ